MTNMKKKGFLYTVATAHLDTMWNWSLETTVRYHIPKTLKQNFALMERYPGYKFNFEGAYRYALMEEYYPALFKELQARAAKGQWVPAGSAWENGDCNLPSPEALFRNFLYGNRYFEEKLGRRCKDVFLPDCFGFGWALPSIARHANLLGFSTQKLSYGPACPVPFDVGRWYGVDGAFVYACLKMGQYETAFKTVRQSPVLLEKLKENRARYGLPVTAAYHGADGDQGGAPKESSVAAVCGELVKNPESPIAVLSAASDQLCRDLDRALTPEQKKRLPRWNGELLLRNHAPGAYTSRTMSKRLNRRCELLADRAERAASAAMWLGRAYPHEQLTEAYKRLIAHQFHDDLTGTAIMTEYERSWNDYFLSLNQLRTEYEGSMSALAGQMDTSWAKGTPLLVHNSTDILHRGCVEAVLPWDGAPFAAVTDGQGNEMPCQIHREKSGQATIVFCAEVPALGVRVYDIQPREQPPKESTALRVTLDSMENQNYRVLLNRNGDIASILDKRQGDLELLESPLRLELIRHTGSRRYPAWEMRYEELAAPPRSFPTAPRVEIIENGAARVALRVCRSADGSRFTQTLYLEDGGEFLRVENEVDWYSKETLLKVRFPLSVENEYADYDLGLGVIRRPSSRKELYEFPAQGFASLTAPDGSRGVALFSDSRFGWDKPDGHTLRLTAIATPKHAFRPESRQDLMDFGLNRFAFGVSSHKGGLNRGVHQQAELFAQPFTAFLATSHKGPLKDSFSFGSLNTTGVQIKAVKRAEDGEELVVRLHECHGLSHENVRLRLGEELLSARELYASEEPLGEACTEDGALVFSIGPYAPKTFGLRLKPPAHRIKAEKTLFLPLPYERNVVSFHDNLRAGKLLEPWESLAGELLPNGLQSGGIPFRWGSPIARENNALSCAGQELPLPNGYERLSLLMTSLKGDRPATFLWNGQAATVPVPDGKEAIGAWDLIGLNAPGYVKNCTVAYAATHTHSRFGDNPCVRAYLFRVDLDIDRKGGVLTLPQDENLLLFAATLSEKRPAAVTASVLYDQLEKRELPPLPKHLRRRALWKR